MDKELAMLQKLYRREASFVKEEIRHFCTERHLLGDPEGAARLIEGALCGEVSFPPPERSFIAAEIACALPDLVLWIRHRLACNH